MRGTFLARKVPKNALHDARARLRRVPCGAPVRRGPQNSLRSDMLRPFFRRRVRASGGRDGGEVSHPPIPIPRVTGAQIRVRSREKPNRARHRASPGRNLGLRNQNHPAMVDVLRLRSPGLRPRRLNGGGPDGGVVCRRPIQSPSSRNRASDIRDLDNRAARVDGSRDSGSPTGPVPDSDPGIRPE